jgi:hypothetical protein
VSLVRQNAQILDERGTRLAVRGVVPVVLRATVPLDGEMRVVQRPT